MVYDPTQDPHAVIASTVRAGGLEFSTTHPAAPLALNEHLGLLLADSAITGSVVYRATDSLFETRATITPNGDYLLMFPTNTAERPTGNCHYGGGAEKINDMLAVRSRDRGRTWEAPTVAFDIDYNQHGFVPLTPRGGKRLYAFGTQPVWGLYSREHGQQENAPIGYRTSDDDGHHWSEVRLIRPQNDPGFLGMSVMRMCETEAGTWLIGAHEGDWSYRPVLTRQYVLRSEDQGRTWDVLPHPRHGGWCVPAFNRMDEGRPIHLGGNRVLLMVRTPEGHLWATRSDDDGRTWSAPAPTPLVHPDAPPMLCHLGDGHTLAAFHHNRYSDRNYDGLNDKADLMVDRAELWVSLSGDEGRTWSEPRFVLANALTPTLENNWRNHQCSYCDIFVDDGVVNVFMPHRWQRALHLQMPETLLRRLPTAEELAGMTG